MSSRAVSAVLHVDVRLKDTHIEEYRFAEDEVVVGRDPACDVFLDNTGVSRRHARIKRAEEGLAVEDLGSSNGTFVNDEAVKEERELSEGDIVRVGKFSLSVRLEDAKAAEPTPDLVGTTILDAEQLQHMLEQMRPSGEGDAEVEARADAALDAAAAGGEAEGDRGDESAPSRPEPPESSLASALSSPLVVTVVAVAAGLGLGLLCAWLVIGRNL